MLLLAEAASEHTAAASTIGSAILRRLLLSSQAQVPWQLFRRWPLISPVAPDDVNLDEIRRISNLSTRRMIFLAQLPRTRTSHHALKLLLGGVAEEIGGGGDAMNDRFGNALLTWAALNTSIYVPGSTALRDFCRIHELLQLASSRGHDIRGSLSEHIALALELDSIERDLVNAEGGYQPHPSEKYSEGRYGYTRHYVRSAYKVVPHDRISALLGDLLYCSDEGIRWAVAAEILNWWALIPDAEGATSVVLRLVSDRHPWVVREALQQLATDPLLCQAIGIDLLVQNAEQSRQRAEGEGYVSSELVVAIKRVAALDPTDTK